MTKTFEVKNTFIPDKKIFISDEDIVKYLLINKWKDILNSPWIIELIEDLFLGIKMDEVKNEKTITLDNFLTKYDNRS